eukprot:NODE_4320_length_686_cov_8.348653.p2 GENE.NODE_4320_length_686_cov_8.348653~~NODE_4320_length_686_cov_8.348653.p2  ORF type:complete len:124 (+),score=34.56 NODE_4320_length_686_cov_8.348653:209-580(+)
MLDTVDTYFGNVCCELDIMFNLRKAFIIDGSIAASHRCPDDVGHSPPLCMTPRGGRCLIGVDARQVLRYFENVCFVLHISFSLEHLGQACSIVDGTFTPELPDNVGYTHALQRRRLMGITPNF